ncbi:5-methyltetrahydropteroyltriglutamate--homocysteine S-methyltransferase [Promicromonospora sp. Populi]|uniref:5-methyltetrahydropteroyltriglutamate-- homocysteine S-methyltransferase n=1 Tax=Promicromonospora sp. Populi TaxID=3239420 RepID=UPI0034E1D0EF
MAVEFTPPHLAHATILGYPRIGRRRELKRAVEALWAGRTTTEELEATARDLRLTTARHLVGLGLDAGSAAVPGSFSFYDQVLDAVALLGAVPERFRDLAISADGAPGRLSLEGYFTLARGEGDKPPLEMTKWFDTNYHYLVPEIGPDTPIGFVDDRAVREFTELAQPADGGQAVVTRPVLVGPVTFLLLSKAAGPSAAALRGSQAHSSAAGDAPAGFRPLDRLDDVVAAYAEVLRALAAAGAPWVQLDEPALVTDLLDVPFDEVADAVRRAYSRLATDLSPAPGADGVPAERPAILVTAPYGGLRSDAGDGLALLAGTDVEAIAVDLVRGAVPTGVAGDGIAGTVPGLETKTLVAGVVDGHNIWRADLDARLTTLEGLTALGAGAVAVGTSTSLLHVPHDVADEPRLDAGLKSWLAFADQKVAEVVTLATGLAEGRAAVADQLAESTAVVRSRAEAPGVVVPTVRERTAGLTPADVERAPYAERAAAQQARLDLPPLPTTTIGSFPQTSEIRQTRAAWVRGELSDAEYTAAMRAEIASTVALQEELGLDVLVHGEPERNDMVQYFAEQLDGFATTVHGWVQSYGSRCVRPPVLWGDVSRPAPLTVDWTAYAASLTSKPVKGMLTGPVTILAWSFVRDDLPLGDTADQVALALRDEVTDLEAAGIGVVQVDEPALRELLPLRRAAHAGYLDWSVRSFRLATSGAQTSTQVHTHLCYSEFGQVIGAIDGLDADVTSVEAARSRMEIVPELADAGYGRGIGPGVYDIHSPRVPSVEEVTDLVSLAAKSIDPRLVWINPDCGLKTRGYAETTDSLRNLVAAARGVRATL